MHTLKGYAIQYNAVLCNEMQCNSMQYNSIQCNAIKYNAIQCSAIQFKYTMHQSAMKAIQYNAIT